ncbi:hypothetical protein PanWU01x14_369460, partial [Parasponia andersonii]
MNSSFGLLRKRGQPTKADQTFYAVTERGQPIVADPTPRLRRQKIIPGYRGKGSAKVADHTHYSYKSARTLGLTLLADDPRKRAKDKLLCKAKTCQQTQKLLAHWDSRRPSTTREN